MRLPVVHEVDRVEGRCAGACDPEAGRGDRETGRLSADAHRVDGVGLRAGGGAAVADDQDCRDDRRSCGDRGGTREERRPSPAARPLQTSGDRPVRQRLPANDRLPCQRLGAADDPLEVRGELARVLVSLRRIDRHRLRDHAVEGVRQGGQSLRRPRPGRVAVGEELRHVVVPRERRLARQREVKDASKGVDVGPMVDRVARDLLRGHVVRASEELARGGDRPALAGRPADAEVREEDPLPAADRLDEDVGGLDVAMDQATGMCGVEPGGNAAEQPGGPPQIQGSLGLDHAAQVAPLDQAHRQIQEAALVAGVIHLHDVRVLQRCRQSGLPLEPLPEPRVVGEGRRDQLQRALAVERQVMGSVDHAHPATTDLGLDPVPGEDRARADRDVVVGVRVHAAWILVVRRAGAGINPASHPAWQDGWMRRLLLLGSAVVFLDVAFYTAITPLLPMYADDLGLSKGSAGILTASYAAGTLIAALPSGFVAASIGPRRALLSGLLLLGLASLAFGFSHHVLLLDIARFVQGVAGALAWAGALTWLILSSPETRRGSVIGDILGVAVAGSLWGR